MRRPPTSPGGSMRLTDETERGWQGQFIEGAASSSSARCAASRRSRSSTRRCSAPPTPASSTNSRPRCSRSIPRPTPPAMLRRKDEETPIHGPVGLFEAVTAAGRKGVALQRYKGLGEMNPQPALGNHARHQCALAAASQRQGNRRGQYDLRRTDGRQSRAAPHVHRGERADRQRGRVSGNYLDLPPRGDRAALGQHQPLAVLALDRVDPADAGQHAAFADVEHAAVAALNKRAAVLHVLNDPILQNPVGDFRRRGWAQAAQPKRSRSSPWSRSTWSADRVCRAGLRVSPVGSYVLRLVLSRLVLMADNSASSSLVSRSGVCRRLARSNPAPPDKETAPSPIPTPIR